jgi:cytochrome c biogenesis protein CcdA/thiol-disulfide isomerase/thioredoxin
MLFALVAGAGTALSPCVLPVLPAVLGAGVTGGRRRPLGIVTGLTLSFTFATVALVYVIDALGLPNDLLRWIAIATLAVFGVILLVPSLSDRVEAWISRVSPGPARGRGDGFGGGFVVGLSLGFVYAPCAGPILAGIITVSAAQDFSAGRLAVALAYAVGSGVVLYALMLGGRRITDRLGAYRGRIQAGMGAVMIVVAGLMAADLDIRFQNAIANDLPAFLVNPTSDLESSSAVSNELANVRGGHGTEAAGEEQAAAGRKLPDLGPAPEITGTQQWFNTPGGKPLSIQELTHSGHVVLVDFWTYTCINCIRTLPHLKALDAAYGDTGLVIIGVHSPEFPFEKDARNVEDAIKQDGLRYPVVQDNDLATWNAFGNQYWPADYLIGADGEVRYVHYGEGQYEEGEQAVRSLLAEAGHGDIGNVGKVGAERPDGVKTPETYLGAARAQGFVDGPINAGQKDFASYDAAKLPPNGLAYGGRWDITDESATAGPGATLSLNFSSRRVFLVLGSPGRQRRVQVELDGKPIAAADAGDDVQGSAVTIGAQRLYRLVELPSPGRHVLTLRFEPGVTGYAFTFG